MHGCPEHLFVVEAVDPIIGSAQGIHAIPESLFYRHALGIESMPK
jgi:hypothetical protein